MHFVLLNAEELEEPAHQEVLHTLSQSPGVVVLLQNDETESRVELKTSLILTTIMKMKQRLKYGTLYKILL